MANISNEMKNAHIINDLIKPKVRDIVSKNSMFLRPIKNEMTKFADKNRDILQSNIIGKQLLLNNEMQNNIFKIFGIKKSEIEDAMYESPYFQVFMGTKSRKKQFKLQEQIMFAIPLLLASGEYYRKRKFKESEYFFMMAFYKPYASIISRHFIHPVNEDQMMYTIEHLTERFDIKKQGSVFAMIEKKAQTSYANYIKTLSKDTITDADLHIVYNSGIQSRLSDVIKGVFDKYVHNKGKYLPFEKGTFEGSDDSEGETFERDIKSDAATKDQMVKKAVSRMIKSPIDAQLIDVAARWGFLARTQVYGQYKWSNGYNDILETTVNEIVNNEYRQLPLFFESIIGSFLSNINPATGVKYSAKDLQSVVFLNDSKKLFKSPNSRDVNVLKARKMLKTWLPKYSKRYVGAGPDFQRNLEYAFHFYCVLRIQKG